LGKNIVVKDELRVRVQSSEPLHKNEFNLLLVWIAVCMRTNRDLSPPNRSPNMREGQQLFFGLRLLSRLFEEFQHPAIQTKIVQHFGGFFHQIKVRQPIGKKDSTYTNCDPNKQEVGFISV
jgi:hypothetical protein